MSRTSQDQPVRQNRYHRAPSTHSRRTLIRAAGAGALALASDTTLVGAARPNHVPVPASRMHARSQHSGEIVTFPRPGSRTASPFTEITFRGVDREMLGSVTVVGSRSGANAGRLMPHADGNGVSFVPDAWFEPGEEVTVTADLEMEPLVFEVARPARQRRAPSDLVTDDPAVPPRTFRSRPDLRPPVMDITTPAEGTDEGLIFLGTRVGGGQAGAMVLDDTGELVWFLPPDNDMNAHYDVRVQEYRGESVVTFAEANAAGPVGWRRGHYVICDATCERIAEFPIGNGMPGGDHHEFLITPEDTALVGAYFPIHWDLSEVGGASDGVAVDYVVQELEIETGRVLFEWHGLDHIGLDESYAKVPGDANGQYDYIHMNSIGVGPDGDLVMSARHTFAAYKISRATGEMLWRLNGKRSDFEMGEGTEFAYTHDARLHEGNVLTIFDNATSGYNTDKVSRGLVIDLDEEAMTATLVQEYIHPTEIVAVSQANVQVLPNGNVFIGWGSAPVFSEFTEDGELIFNGRFPKGGSSYRAYRFPWSAQPTEPPAIAAEVADDGSLTVYASWNGATEVASWRVLGGESEADLAEVGSAERSGFETEIPVDSTVAFVAVEALDASGAVLGASDPIEVDG